MNSPESKSKRALIHHSAQEKCRAVLSVWSERRKAAEICKELEIHAALFAQWQERAMEAMLRALEPKNHNAPTLPALTPRLQKLLLRRVLKQESKVAKLRERLEKIQQVTKPQVKPS